MLPPIPLKTQLNFRYSKEREAIFLNKFCYDLKIAAINNGYRLQLHRTEVDDAGVDIVADWGTGLRKLQLKTCCYPKGATSWKINATLLKPTSEDECTRRISQWQAYHPFGINGAVLLADIAWQNELPKIRYSCTDLYLLMMLRDNILPGKSSQQVGKVLERVAASPFTAGHTVNLNRGCFVRAATPTALLELLSLPTRVCTSWKQQFHRIYCAKERARSGTDPNQAAGLVLARMEQLVVPTARHVWRD